MRLRFLFTCILSLFLLAQTGNSAPVGSEKLAERLRFYAPIRELRVDFQQIKHLKDLGLDLKSEGRLQIQRPDQVTWEILKPAHLRVQIDRDKVQMTEGEGAPQTFELTKMSKDNAARGMSLLLPWLILDVKALSAQYAINSEDERHFTFKPRADSKMFERMDVTLGKSGHMEKLVLYEVSGDSMEISFREPQVLRREGDRP